LGQSGDGDAGLGAIATDMADMEIPEFGRFVFGFGSVGVLFDTRLHILIIGIEKYGRVHDVLHVDVVDENIIDEAASSHIAFEAQPDVCSGEGAVADEDIVQAATITSCSTAPSGCTPLDFMQMPSSPALTVH
jgi:hypothetical protein